MRAELKSLGELQHTTSLYVTHDYLEALALGDRIAVLRQGQLVQVGTREEVWNRPADTFVARAFGQPEINLVAGEVAGGPDGPAFRSTDGAMVVPLPGVAVPSGTPVELGLRPRDVTLGEGEGRGGMIPLRGRVYVVEPLGRQLEVTVDVGASRIALITEREHVEPDTLVSLAVPSAKLLLFDGATGRRLELGPLTAAALDARPARETAIRA
jgi:multiple sugar transport system ATP-binding protein